ncbi:MAG: hypothetical protein WBW33_30065 [Bryobacteraceae bacterium]
MVKETELVPLQVTPVTLSGPEGSATARLFLMLLRLLLTTPAAAAGTGGGSDLLPLIPLVETARIAAGWTDSSGTDSNLKVIEERLRASDAPLGVGSFKMMIRAWLGSLPFASKKATRACVRAMVAFPAASSGKLIPVTVALPFAVPPPLAVVPVLTARASVQDVVPVQAWQLANTSLHE